MYAMSVSPLTKKILEKLEIDSELFVIRNERTEERKKPLKARDFTNNIKISTEVFEIKTIKGKKTVILPWEQLDRIRNTIPAEMVYRGLRGSIIFRNQYSLLAGEKLELILSLALSLDPENALTREWPHKKNFSSAGDLPQLLKYLDLLARPARWKRDSKELGFLGLFCSGDGNYWLRCSRGFHTSLNESMASLETLIDEIGDNADISIKQAVNQTYRRLSKQIMENK